MDSLSYYTERLKQHGATVQALGWGSVESQQVRFKVLSEIAYLGGRSVLDFGCGFGDLYWYLRVQARIRDHEPPNYTGYDCHQGMLEAARRRYPAARFVDRPVEADYVLASGTLNLDHFWKDTLTEMWALCRRGLAVNFTSQLADRYTPGILYFDPFTVASFCSTLSRKFTLRHDYKPNDFCCYLYR